uniref:Uncharacterized protein n=1 Tax=Branchiostoma floridae TaxID=7739 RepID=C3YD02_BRAFL|eukprot:XP_002605943.1 hypothetical protein BRAFLDRAFT_87375 [Branchiostoma floridae]
MNSSTLWIGNQEKSSTVAYSSLPSTQSGPELKRTSTDPHTNIATKPTTLTSLITLTTGCEHWGQFYPPGSIIQETKGCMGRGVRCDEDGHIIVWDRFGYGCCEHNGEYFEDGATITEGGVSCHCDGSDTAEPAPMVCPPDHACRSGWRKHNNHCYKLMTDRVSWDTANNGCKNQSANLASIHSQAEMNFVSALITNDNNECTKNPCQHGRCVNKDGGYKCTCSPGWTGQNCQQDINECIRNPCQHGRCVNKDGGYKCTCSPGWTGQNCQQDINECIRNPCQPGRCVNKDGGYKCTCSPGWTGQNCQQDHACNSGWREHNNHCYKLMTDRVNWGTANSRCKNQRANLASIHSQAEMNFVSALITNDWQAVDLGRSRGKGTLE